MKIENRIAMPSLAFISREGVRVDILATGPEAYRLAISGAVVNDSVEPSAVITSLAAAANCQEQPRLDGEWRSGAWDIGRAAQAIAAFLLAEGRDVAFSLDGEEWSGSDGTDVEPSDLRFSQAVIDSIVIEQDPLTATPGNSDGIDFCLMKFGTHYRVFRLSGGDSWLDQGFEAEDDDAARAMFAQSYSEHVDGVRTPESFVRVIHRDEDGSSRTWRAWRSVDGVTIQTPAGERQVEPVGDGEGEAILTAMTRVDPAVWVVTRECDIECDEDTASWLPMYPVAADSECQITVNGSDWPVIPGPDDTWIAVPDADVRSEWASFGWSESASMVSGWDSTRIGWCTDKLGIALARFNDGDESYAHVFRVDDPAEHVDDWIWSNELAETLRSVWPGTPEDLIAKGFVALIEQGVGYVEIDGAKLRPSEWEAVFGLTETADWWFSLAADPSLRRNLAKRWDVEGAPSQSTQQTKQPTGRTRRTRPSLDTREIIPQSVLLRCKKALAAPSVEELLQQATSDLERRLAEARRRDSDREAATETLQLSLDATRKEIFRRVEQMVSEHPARSSEFWSAAYDLLPRDSEPITEAQKLVTRLNNQKLELVESANHLGWPKSWDLRLLPMWLELQGTGESARTWCGAGWTAEDVLCVVQLGELKGMHVSQRVRTTQVPDQTT